MLTSKLTDTVQVPGEDVSVTIRKLSYRQLEEAETVKRDAAIKMFASLSDIADKLPKGEATESADDPANKYDRGTVLKYGLIGWSYEDPCDDANKEDLDEPMAAFVSASILTFSLRSKAEGEASGSG